MNDTNCCPDVAALARQADMNYQFKVLVSILGAILVFSFALTLWYVLFTYQAPQPEPPRGRSRTRRGSAERGMELGDLGRDGRHRR
ncbi:hypothetical protein FHL15_007436 [Xylaria flabelliformis]|uniref:Uncharacterized protein n=1 Tax=Xylaria flabelliformis TaxID=2512241 RepID=A0A553HUN4_9PEZI|nr:hypothetical protein FHL15_007436 [Xylaria flabelliformis]